MANQLLAPLLEPRDLVVIAQGTGEPTGLIRQLIQERDQLPDVELFAGRSESGVLAMPGGSGLRWSSFGAMGPLSRLEAIGELAIIPCNFSDVPRLLRCRAPGRLVVLLHVATADPDGMHSLGTSVDYAYELLEDARLVIGEVNDQLPATSAPRVPGSRFGALWTSSRPVQVVEEAAPTNVQRRIAATVAGLVPDGATIQLGVGAMPAVVAEALQGRRRLKVHSTLVGSWLVGLAESGALARDTEVVRACEATGNAKLYEFVVNAGVRFLPVSELTRPGLLETIDGLVAMNSALEVDLTGQVNAETLDSGYVACIGGQADFMRAAQRSRSGFSVVMLPATASSGRSRIVAALQQGTVSTPRSAVDFVVTEYGVADLRGRDLDQRRRALIRIAAPQHRKSLRAHDQQVGCDE